MGTQAYNKAQVGALLFDEAPTVILVEYSNYSNIFSAKNATELSEHTKMNDYTIKLVESRQPLFESIYNLRLVKLETLKIYIKIIHAIGFIWYFKSPARALILFN